MRREPLIKRRRPAATVAEAATLSEPLPRWAPSAIIAVTTLAMLAWTWGRWPDLLIDFSRDLYVASQLAHGKVLSRCCGRHAAASWACESCSGWLVSATRGC